jgi:hypothetical protein
MMVLASSYLRTNEVVKELDQDVTGAHWEVGGGRVDLVSFVAG